MSQQLVDREGTIGLSNYSMAVNTSDQVIGRTDHIKDGHRRNYHTFSGVISQETNTMTMTLQRRADLSHKSDILNGQEEQQDGSSKMKALSRRKKGLLVTCALSQLMSGCVISLLAPFYPQVALEKGMTVPLIGFTFSLHPIIIFLISPVIASHLTKTGPKFVLLSGIFLAGVSTILYGLLDKCPPGTVFLVTSLSCRCMEALGFSAFITAIMSITTSEFPDRVSTVFAIIEMTSEIGMMVGPAVGGFLYELGGFGLPFYVLGISVLLNGIVVYNVLPAIDSTTNTEKAPIWFLLRCPMVVVAMATISMESLGISFLESTLANRLQPLHVAAWVIGLVFVIPPGLFALTSPLIGFLTDSKGLYSYLIVSGHVVSGLGFLFVGPSRLLPFLQFELWTVNVGQVLIGCGSVCGLIPTMKCLMIGARESGWEDNLETYAAVSGLFNAAYSFGAFTGPLVGGVLIEHFGYRLAYTFIGCLSLSMALVTSLVFIHRFKIQMRHCSTHSNNGSLIK